MDLGKIYGWLYPPDLTLKLKNMPKIISQFVFFFVHIGFGTLITILLYSLPNYAITTFEKNISIIAIFLLVLIWCGFLLLMKGIFIIFTIPLYLTLFIQNNFYYPIWTLIMAIIIPSLMIFEKLKAKGVIEND